MQATRLSPLYRHKWALVVGVNYRDREDARTTDKNAAALPPLSNAVRDAEGIVEVLKKYYEYQDEHIFVLLEEQATASAIEDKMGELLNTDRVDPEDSVLVFFAGHGARRDGGTSFLA
jgi:uncharacterized caspase-like protein